LLRNSSQGSPEQAAYLKQQHCALSKTNTTKATK
jgi:hypothetical protein